MTASIRPRYWQLNDPEHTRAAGLALGRALMEFNFSQPVLITLQGELGAGKTTLVSGLLQGLGHVGQVPSPTYTLIEPYDLQGRSIFHLDLYRLVDPYQFEDIGWRDLLQPEALLLVEWPERAGGYLPLPDLSIQLSYPEKEQGRQLALHPGSESLQQLVDRLDF